MTDLEEIKYWCDFIDGDLNSLSILFMQYSRGLISYGMKICRDEELVKDSIQEVFILLIQKRQKLNRDLKIRGLVFRLLRNKMIDEIKLINRRKNHDPLEFNGGIVFESDSEHHYIGVEEEMNRDNLLSWALDQLSSHQKEVMFLKYSNALSYEEISEVMGISIASARTLIYRTLKQMKSLLSISERSEISASSKC